VLLALSYIISVVDTIFHVTSDTVDITFSAPYPSSLSTSASFTSSSPSPLPDFSRQFKQTLCNTPAPPANASQLTKDKAWLCGLVEGGADNMYMVSRTVGLLTFNNGSATHTVALADDQTALLIPSVGALPESAKYVASTFGIRTSCERCVGRVRLAIMLTYLHGFCSLTCLWIFYVVSGISTIASRRSA
jgi:hypothetical protein